MARAKPLIASPSVVTATVCVSRNTSTRPVACSSFADVLADRRLTDTQPGGRLREAMGLGDREERPQLGGSYITGYLSLQ